jgi:cobalt-zinc-cadmium efflux system outer membrane protein
VTAPAFRRVGRPGIPVALLLASLVAAGSQGCAPRYAPAPDAALLEVSGPPEPRDVETLTAPVADTPEGEITLAEAVDLAVRNNPRLRAADRDVRAHDGLHDQARRLPNPTLETLSEDLAGSGRFIPEVSQPQTTVGLSQLVELGGDRGARARVATLDRTLAGWDREAVRLEVRAQAVQAFVALQAAQQLEQLATRLLGLAEQTAAAVGERVAAGAVSPVEEARVGVAVAEARIDVERARLDVDAARQRLAALWSAGPPRFARAAGEMPAVTPVESFDAVARLRDGNPDLARWVTESAQREAALRLERARAIPDVTLTAGYRRFQETDNNALVVGASVPLPLFDRNQGNVAAASSRVAAASEQRRAAEARVDRGLAEAYRDLVTAHTEASMLAAEAVPRAERAYGAFEEGYRLGKFGVLDVLDAQRTLFAVRTQYLRAVERFHTAAAGIERLVGQPPSSTEGSAP